MVELNQPIDLQRAREQLRRRLGLFVSLIVVIFVAILPFFLEPFLQSLVTKILILAVFAMSLDILFGSTGLFSMGHAAFFGAGAYTAGVLMVRFGVTSFWIGAPAGIAMAGILAAIFGIVALRVSGLYFLLVTFALGQLIFTVVWKWVPITGGSDGFTGIRRPDIGLPGFVWDTTSYYYFVLLAAIICYYLISRFIGSPFGLALQGIRENNPRMRSLGYNTWLYMYIAFVVAGLFAGAAGVMYAYYNGAVFPEIVDVSNSASVMVMVILGGAGTLFGPVIGVAVIYLLQHFISGIAPERWPLILGAIFVLTVMFLRQGISLYILGRWRKG